MSNHKKYQLSIYLTYLVNNKKYINKSNDLYLFIIIRKNYIIYNNLIGKLKTHNY